VRLGILLDGPGVDLGGRTVPVQQHGDEPFHGIEPEMPTAQGILENVLGAAVGLAPGDVNVAAQRRQGRRRFGRGCAGGSVGHRIIR